MDYELEKWINTWEEIQKSLPKEEPMSSNNHYLDYFEPNESPEDNIKDDIDWTDAYQDYANSLLNESKKNKNINEAVNVAYAGSEGFGKEEPKNNKLSKGKKKYLNNPIPFSTVGNDAKKDNGKEGIKVTDNFGNGEDLIKLEKMFKDVYDMEQKYYKAEFKDDKSKETLKIKKQLKSLRKKIEDLENKISPDPRTDLA